MSDVDEVLEGEGEAVLEGTFDLPVLSSQPCMLMLALLPVLGCAAAFWGRRRVPA